MYSELWSRSNGRMGPRETDELYIWEIALLLGHASELESAEGDDAKAPLPSDGGMSFIERATMMAEQRLAAAEGRGPGPTAAPVDPSTFPKV